MNEELDERYLDWLYSQIRPTSVKHHGRTNYYFAKQLFQKEFIWLIPNDDNRLVDGRDLRFEFLREADIKLTHNDSDSWLYSACSMLEMLVALSRRFAFMGGSDPRDSFWVLIENLDLPECYDVNYKEDPDLHAYVNEALDRIIWRTYDYDGAGGLFPLMHPHKDQRKTELWYQMSAYILEQEGGIDGFL